MLSSVSLSALSVCVVVDLYLSSLSCQAEERWLGHVLNDTDWALYKLLSERADSERINLSLQFLLAYKGLLERLVRAARLRDPSTIEVLRHLESQGGRPQFTKVLPDLSVYQEALNWPTEDLNIARDQLMEIYDLLDQFKESVHYLIDN